MLKEVGASGQITLGKKYAGQLYEVNFHADGRVELIPMRAVPAVRPAAAELGAADGWLPPGGYAQCTQWAIDNRAALDAYAARIDRDGTAAELLQRYLMADPAGPVA